MDIKYIQYAIDRSSFKGMAQAYGTDSYGGNSYNGSPVTSTAPQAPSTGFFAEPPIIVFPTLLIAAILLGIITFLVGRILRRRKKTKP